MDGRKVFYEKKVPLNRQLYQLEMDVTGFSTQTVAQVHRSTEHIPVNLITVENA